MKESDHFDSFISSQTQSGHYGSASGMADYDLDSLINELDSEERK